LIAAGISLHDDIVPELAEVAAHSRDPRRTLGDLQTVDQIRRRHRRRLHETSGSSASPPIAGEEAVSAGLRWKSPTAGTTRNFEFESLQKMAGNA